VARASLHEPSARPVILLHRRGQPRSDVGHLVIGAGYNPQIAAGRSAAEGTGCVVEPEPQLRGPAPAALGAELVGRTAVGCAVRRPGKARLGRGATCAGLP